MALSRSALGREWNTPRSSCIVARVANLLLIVETSVSGFDVAAVVL